MLRIPDFTFLTRIRTKIADLDSWLFKRKLADFGFQIADSYCHPCLKPSQMKPAIHTQHWYSFIWPFFVDPYFNVLMQLPKSHCCILFLGWVRFLIKLSLPHPLPLQFPTFLLYKTSTVHNKILLFFLKFFIVISCWHSDLQSKNKFFFRKIPSRAGQTLKYLNK